MRPYRIIDFAEGGCNEPKSMGQHFSGCSEDNRRDVYSVKELQLKSWAKQTGVSVVAAEKASVKVIGFSPKEKQRWVDASKSVEQEWGS